MGKIKGREGLSHLEAELLEGMERKVTKEEMFYNEGGEILAQVAHRSSGCPITVSAQSQAGWSSEQHK